MNLKAVALTASVFFCMSLGVMQASADDVYFSGDVSEEALLNAFVGGNQAVEEPAVVITEREGIHTRAIVFGEHVPTVPVVDGNAPVDADGYRDLSWQVVGEASYVVEDASGNIVFTE